MTVGQLTRLLAQYYDKPETPVEIFFMNGLGVDVWIKPVLFHGKDKDEVIVAPHDDSHILKRAGYEEIVDDGLM